MAQLKHLRLSISEMPSSDALSLIKSIRATRRAVREQRAIAFTIKEEAKKTRAASKKKSAVSQLNLDTLSAETLEAILGLLTNMLEPGEPDGEDSVQDEGTPADLD